MQKKFIFDFKQFKNRRIAIEIQKDDLKYSWNLKLMLIIFLNLNLYQKKIICKKNNNNYNKKIIWTTKK